MARLFLEHLQINYADMKRLFKIDIMAVALVFCFAACNNNDGSSIPKGQPAIVHGDSSGGSGSSPTRLGTGASDVPGGTPTPNPDTGASKQNRVNADTTSNNSKAHKIP